MRKIVSAVLCAATLLTLGGCKNDPVPSPTVTTQPSSPSSSIEQEMPDSIIAAIKKTTAQTSFRMTLSIKNGPTEDRFDLKVNDFASEKMLACGTVTQDGETDSFSVNQEDYCLLKSDATLTTGKLAEDYSPCSALVYWSKLSNLLNGNALNNAKVEAHSDSEVTLALPTEEFNRVWGMPGFNDVSLRISLTSDGYCSDALLLCSLSDTSMEFRFHFEDFAVKQEITPIHAPTVTEDQWKKAFASSSFENVTILRYYDDRNKEKPITTFITPSVSAKSLNYELVDSNTQITGMAYYYQFGGRFYEMETGTATDASGNKVNHYKLIPTDKYKGETPGSYAAYLDATFGFANLFNNFVYDEETQSYQGEGSDDAWNYQYSLTFNHGRLTSIVQTLLTKNTNEIRTVHSYYFNNYGTTVLKIPNVS